MNDLTKPEQTSNAVSKYAGGGVDVIDFNLADLVDMVELNLLLANFCNSVGIASAIIDLQGKVLIASRWQRICTEFHRINETTCARCIESDTDLALHLKAGENFSVYKCKNGMTDAASPIIIEGRHLANVFVGQFLIASPDLNFFGRQAEQVGFDRQPYFEALGEVPIVSEEKLPSILGFLSGFANLVASMGLQRLRAERVSAELSNHQKKLEQLIKHRSSELELQNRILEQIGSGVPLPGVLDTLSRQVELLHPEMLCSILLLDESGRHLLHGSAPSLPDFYNQAVNGLEIGNGVGSCGTAAYRGERVIVEDIRLHPYWAAFGDLAIRAGVQSCWSQPIKNSLGLVLGTFAIYHAKPIRPAQTEIILIERYANLAQIVIESHRAQNELRIAATAFESQEGMLITDARNVILRVNSAFTKITGYTAEEAIGRRPNILRSGRQNAEFYAAMWESIRRTGSWKGEIWNRRKNEEIYPQHLTVTAVKDAGGNITNYVAVFNDITTSKAAEEEIMNLAFYDSLTGLPNRRLLLDRLKQALASSARSGREGALLFIDLDNFKTLNDTLGHDMGDTLLQQVAQRLSSCVREGDTAARMGGDEFVVMLEDLSEHALEAAAQTEAAGEKILATLNQPYQLDSYEYRSTPSIGATLFNGHQSGMDELFKQVDIAMYQAKKAGRNALRFFDPQMQTTVNARAALEGELRKALDGQQFHLYYQIQMDSSLRPLGAEALIRWIHPERGLVPPAQFIPLAEETGLILHIGLWVLDTACAQLKAWQQNALTSELVLAVNVSAKQFRQADFVAQIQSAVQRHAIDPTLLKLELTESLLIENIHETIATMNALKEIGVQFSLDDFGTGYSSLQYLKQLPLDQLKIDQSFIRDITVDNSDKTIVSTVIAMAHSLNLNAIAEGVELEEQRQLLLSNGCTHYQGYLFGKPVPIEQFEALLKPD